MSDNTDKTHESLRILGNGTYFNEKTKRVVSEENVNIQVSMKRHRLPKSKENFMLIYQSGLTEIAQLRLSGMDLSVLFYLLGQAGYEPLIAISQEKIAQDLDCHRQMVSRSLINLKKVNLIRIISKKGYGSFYFLNPYYFVRGTAKTRDDAVFKWEQLAREEAVLARQKERATPRSQK